MDIISHKRNIKYNLSQIMHKNLIDEAKYKRLNNIDDMYNFISQKKW